MPSLHNTNISVDEKNMVTKCISCNPNFDFNELTRKIECICCRDKWEIAGLESRPLFEFSINSSTEFSISRHEKADRHGVCEFALENYDKNKSFYEHYLEKAQSQAEIMTTNVIKVVYFLFKQDLSMNVFEKLIEMLDCCNALIGTQLHSSNTAKAIALTIDDLFQKLFVNFLLSDNCREFGMISDELTDVGGLKCLLTRFRFFEGYDLQEFVFSIFESVGTSEDMVQKFEQDFINQFLAHTNIKKESILKLIYKKLNTGGSDRASKMICFANKIEENNPNYTHFPCDPHITETAWEEVQTLSKVKWAETLVKLSSKLFINSASQNLKLAEIGREINEKTLNPKPLFKIKYLTSETSVTRATLTDHLQILKLTEILMNDKTVKKAKRNALKELHLKLRDVRGFLNLIALNEVLKDGISSYQMCTQTRKACAFEREFEKRKLYAKLKTLSEQKSISKEKKELIRKIDIENKIFSKINIKANYVPSSYEEMENKIIKTRREIAEKFEKEKEELHAICDPPFLKSLSLLFDVRNWKLLVFNDKTSTDALVKEFENALVEHKKFLHSVHLNLLDKQIKLALKIMETETLLPQMKAKDFIVDQWKMVLQHPYLKGENALEIIIQRIQISAESNADCEQENSKYNRFKNKYFNRMGIPMIKARARAGSNGPPMNLFPAKKVLSHWKEHNL